MTAHTDSRTLSAVHHDRGVPPDPGAVAPLDVLVTGEPRFQLGGDGVHVIGGRQRRDRDTLLAGAFEVVVPGGSWLLAGGAKLVRLNHLFDDIPLVRPGTGGPNPMAAVVDAVGDSRRTPVSDAVFPRAPAIPDVTPGSHLPTDGHPAVDAPELRAGFPDWHARVDDHELVTTDTGIRTMLERSGARLIGYRELRELQRRGA